MVSIDRIDKKYKQTSLLHHDSLVCFLPRPKSKRSHLTVKLVFEQDADFVANRSLL